MNVWNPRTTERNLEHAHCVTHCLASQSRTSVKLSLLTNGNRCGVDPNTFFKVIKPSVSLVT